MVDAAQWKQLVRQVEREAQIATDLLAEQPELGVTAFVIAGDKVSAELASFLVEEGMCAARAVWRVGSYARFQWAVDHLPEKTLLRMLAALWVHSDPDDTNPEYLKLWRKAWLKNKRQTVCDGDALPNDKRLLIYRGQAENARVGFAWTLNHNIAERFAQSGGLRGRINNGVVLSSNIEGKRVYAYLTDRGEQEIIIDPKHLQYRIGRNQ